MYQNHILAGTVLYDMTALDNLHKIELLYTHEKRNIYMKKQYRKFYISKDAYDCYNLHEIDKSLG